MSQLLHWSSHCSVSSVNDISESEGRTNKCTYIHTYIHTYIRTVVCSCVCTYVCMYVCMYMPTYVLNASSLHCEENCHDTGQLFAILFPNQAHFSLKNEQMWE